MTNIPWANVNALYQLAVRSFQDTDRDGIGDLPGVIDRLPYLRDTLGIDAVWLTPFYPTGMIDFGYDVREYTSVDPALGSMDDLRELVDQLHSSDMKVMIDLVLNHTSNQHPWFQESRSSTTNLKRDWYVWQDPAPDGSTPNNWHSKFGGSAWSYDETTGQYYLHTFFKEQPDLNWENPDVREAIKQVMRFWFDFGVDGLRADAAIYISKDQLFRDNPPNPHFVEGQDEQQRYLEKYSSYGDHLQEFLREVTDVAREYGERLIVFEAYPEGRQPTIERYRALYAVDPTVSLPLMLETSWAECSATALRQVITEFQSMVDLSCHGVMYSFSNHDRSRIASRMSAEQTRLIALLSLSLPGVPTVYYGDELGMLDGVVAPHERYDTAQQSHMPLGRDSARTPMHWHGGKQAGFTDGTPWLPVGADAVLLNVEAELRDSDSLLALYHTALQLRRSHAVMRHGEFELEDPTDTQVLSFWRSLDGQRVCVLLNFSDQPVRRVIAGAQTILCATHPATPPQISTLGEVYLKPFEGIIVECKENNT